MSIARLQIGEPLPIRLNAFDGNAGLFPQVILRDASDTLLGTFDLTHVGDGLYKNSSETFPATTLVTAVYKVYSDAGHTLLEPNYQDMLDVFLQAAGAVSPNSIQIVERVEATLRQSKIKTLVTTAKIQTTLKVVRVKAMLTQPKIMGILKQPKIAGILRECC